MSGAWLRAEPETFLTAALDFGSLSSFDAVVATVFEVFSFLAIVPPLLPAMRTGTVIFVRSMAMALASFVVDVATLFVGAAGVRRGKARNKQHGDCDDVLHSFLLLVPTFRMGAGGHFEAAVQPSITDGLSNRGLVRPVNNRSNSFARLV